jgi:hypothetical protein
VNVRTDDEILARIEQIKEADFFGFETGDLVVCLPFEKAKKYLIDTVKSDEWNVTPHDRDSVVKTITEYMEFAWDKACNGRGISAGRSMAHYNALVWLAGDDLGDLNHYQFYGKDNLRKICDHYGLDAEHWDDGVREN